MDKMTGALDFLEHMRKRLTAADIAFCLGFAGDAWETRYSGAAEISFIA
jgi:hypothetical protein